MRDLSGITLKHWNIEYCEIYRERERERQEEIRVCISYVKNDVSKPIVIILSLLDLKEKYINIQLAL